MFQRLRKLSRKKYFLKVLLFKTISKTDHVMTTKFAVNSLVNRLWQKLTLANSLLRSKSKSN